MKFIEEVGSKFPYYPEEDDVLLLWDQLYICIEIFHDEKRDIYTMYDLYNKKVVEWYSDDEEDEEKFENCVPVKIETVTYSRISTEKDYIRKVRELVM